VQGFDEARRRYALSVKGREKPLSVRPSSCKLESAAEPKLADEADAKAGGKAAVSKAKEPSAQAKAAEEEAAKARRLNCHLY
jgi:hypothetical protein